MIDVPMDRFRDALEVDERSAWLNTAHQGRLPRRAARALEEDVRSSLVVVEPLAEPAGSIVARLTEAGIHVAHRRGRIRVSPHLYNTAAEIDRLLDLL
jgi:selenocysteine lyase/cysteine desulfurase